MTKVRRKLDQEKERQRHYHDTHVKDDLPVLLPGDPVRMAPCPDSTKWQHATLDSRHQSPRSYVVEHNGRKYRINRRHLRLSTIGADHQIHTLRARSTATSRVTRLAAVTPPGHSSGVQREDNRYRTKRSEAVAGQPGVSTNTGDDGRASRPRKITRGTAGSKCTH